MTELYDNKPNLRHCRLSAAEFPEELFLGILRNCGPMTQKEVIEMLYSKRMEKMSPCEAGLFYRSCNRIIGNRIRALRKRNLIRLKQDIPCGNLHSRVWESAEE